ncbi:hypothetical protein H6F43_03190 [Leptolyngbya sp. FACHB-36]|uniref:hypothetical protein n=1 Tax=Leptolyngbya sp. FACHB-36 TaxID=2692808 RepID=UPI001681A5BE|nr:hypothetical protein [Leptolyngbya sp. FACHB-36]MBD2019188.1 hypothetical protein [Leptolyngbya sp. FACHB-36]
MTTSEIDLSDLWVSEIGELLAALGIYLQEGFDQLEEGGYVAVSIEDARDSLQLHGPGNGKVSTIARSLGSPDPAVALDLVEQLVQALRSDQKPFQIWREALKKSPEELAAAIESVKVGTEHQDLRSLDDE